MTNATTGDVTLSTPDGPMRVYEAIPDGGATTAAIVIVGFCFGGRTTFLAAIRRPLGASVGFYGGGIVTGRFPQFPPLVDESASLQSPWLGLFGDADQSIPAEDVERLRATLDEQ